MRTLAAGWICTLACASAIAAPSTGIEALTAYAGEWKAEITHLDTPFSKAGHESFTLRNDCWLSGTFYACHQYVDGDSKAVIVFAFDAKSNNYSSYPITPGASTVQAGKLLIDGHTWTFPWQTTDNGKTTWFRVVNVFSAAGAIEFRQEYSVDQIHWIAMASGHEQLVVRDAAGSGK